MIASLESVTFKIPMYTENYRVHALFVKLNTMTFPYDVSMENQENSMTLSYQRKAKSYTNW